MKNQEFKKCLVELVKNYLTLPEDVAIQSLMIDATITNYPRITLTLVRADSLDKAIEI